MPTYALGFKEDRNPAWQLIASNRPTSEELEFNILHFEDEVPPHAQLILLEVSDEHEIRELKYWDRATTSWRDISAASIPTHFWYLATPYAKYPAGPDAAFEAACEQTTLLKRNNISVYSPIVHCHPLEGRWRKSGHNFAQDMGRFWLTMNMPMMKAAYGLIVCKLATWHLSDGIAWEITHFKQELGKPIIEMEPGIVPTKLT